jgi:hypothetical protein
MTDGQRIPPHAQHTICCTLQIQRVRSNMKDSGRFGPINILRAIADRALVRLRHAHCCRRCHRCFLQLSFLFLQWTATGRILIAVIRSKKTALYRTSSRWTQRRFAAIFGGSGSLQQQRVRHRSTSPGHQMGVSKSASCIQMASPVSYSWPINSGWSIATTTTCNAKHPHRGPSPRVDQS